MTYREKAHLENIVCGLLGFKFGLHFDFQFSVKNIYIVILSASCIVLIPLNDSVMQGRKNWPISSINTIVLNLLSLQTEAEVSTNVPGRCVPPTMGDNQCIPSERRTNQENSQSAHAHLNENLPTMESAESWIIVHMCVLHRKIQHKDTERCKIIPIWDALEQISILKGKK